VLVPAPLRGRMALPGGVEWIGRIKALFALPPRPCAPAGGHPALAVIAASPARCGSLPERRAARRSAAQRGLDQRLGMG
jgi:hypothetical protein